MTASAGDRVVHRGYVSHDLAHYAGNLVDGAWGLARFGDAATELCMVADGDEGLLAGYDEVRFLAPIHGGDVVEVVAEVMTVGRRSRRIRFTATVIARSAPRPGRPGAGHHLTDPVLATTAVGVVVVPGE
ncbi:hotdog domain-containing protein [Nocardioides alcanivorans]|uniref:hotdog domain-containing protein n=1 Tax=Nocardioides alcanivorans TaxID=2897352 RepID=UPI001F379763|nr:hotdog domain-containing protein [Nocardioides alcanivorans]